MPDGYRPGRSGGGARRLGGLASATEIILCLRLISRLPLPALPGEDEPHARPELETVARMLPAAGAVLASLGALALLLGLGLGFGPWLSATLALATLTLASGAFHEDGLADTADGLGGGANAERRLEIMRDSRIGSFGASALTLGFALRIAALATLAARVDSAGAAAAVVATGAVSRAAALVPMMLLRPARSDGLAAKGRPSLSAFRVAWLWAAGIGFGLALLTSLPLLGMAMAFALAIGAALLVTGTAARLIGGHTGDLGGAAQQLGEVAAMLGLLIAVPG